MKFWITTHWPPREDESIEEPHFGIWVQDGKQHLIDRVSAGELVFVYESQSGRTAIRSYADGSTRRIRCRLGRGGIVGLIEVTERAYEIENSEIKKYTDGSKAWWRHCAPTRTVNSAGFIPREVANSLLGYSENNALRGFGEEHSGLKEISEELFDQMLSAFTRSMQSEEQKVGLSTSRARFGGGGEGPEHLALKRQIKMDPAGTLKESGLILWEEEWPFPTGDRVDLILKDRFGRFVAVEVEVCCDASELAGPLQCMKYRAMLSYLFQRPIEEVRCILVASSIHDSVGERCRSHGIEIKTLPIPALHQAAPS